jgi:hypothetical protein
MCLDDDARVGRFEACDSVSIPAYCLKWASFREEFTCQLGWGEAGSCTDTSSASHLSSCSHYQCGLRQWG